MALSFMDNDFLSLSFGTLQIFYRMNRFNTTQSGSPRCCRLRVTIPDRSGVGDCSFVQLSLLNNTHFGIIMIEYHMLWDGILFAPDIEHIMSVNAVVHRDL